MLQKCCGYNAMVMKKTPNKQVDASLFAGEERIIAQMNSVVENREHQGNPLLDKLAFMFRSYKKMFRQFKMLTSMSSKQQNMLMEARKKAENAYEIQSTISSILHISLQPASFQEQLEKILNILLTNPTFGLQGTGCIFLADQETRILKMKAHKGLSDYVFSVCHDLPFGKCLCGQAAVTRKIVFSSCVDDNHEIKPDNMQNHGHYCVPIMSNEEVLGVFNIYLHAGHEHCDQEEGFLLAIASTLAGIIERQRTEEALSESRKQLEELVVQLKEARNQAVSANKTKSMFLANMSHEIRTPLTAILGFADALLDDGLADPSQHSSVEIILSNGKHLLTLVNDILDLSKIEANKLEVEKIAMAPAQLIRDVELLMNNVAMAKGLQFEIVYDFPLPQLIHSDPTRLKQIIFNLCNNAIKFTEQGKVQLITSYDTADHRICFGVVDSGIGLTEEQQKRIFAAFEQADGSTTRKYGGTGLGLHISRRLAMLLGGDIEVLSIFGEYSRFNVWIDAGENANKELVNSIEAFMQQSESASTTTNIPSLCGNILLVEDGVDNQRLISTLLTKIGLTVDIAENGKIAIEKALAKHYDLLLMDMQMPIMGGEEAIGILMGHGYKIPIVALTGNVLTADKDKLLAIGCRDILAKPIERKEFFSVLERFLETNIQKSTAVFPKPKPKLAVVTSSISGHILVAEDDEMNQKLVTRLLKRMGLTLDMAENGEQAIELALANDYDLILMDMQMPIMGGIEATTTLRQLSYELPIIACTANVMDDDIQIYNEIGCNDIIPKPIIRAFFVEILEKYLTKPNIDADQDTTASFEVPQDLCAKIFVAEANSVITPLLNEIFQQTAVEIENSNNSDACIEIALTGNFDLVLVDMQMQGAEEAITMLFDINYETPILVCIAVDQQENRKKYIELGCQDTFSKAVTNDELKQILASNLSTWHTRDVKVTEPETDNDDDYDETIKQLTRQFVAGLPKTLQDIGLTVDAADWATLESHLHTLKGTAGSFGHPEITTFAEQAETLVKQQAYEEAINVLSKLNEHCETNVLVETCV